MRNPALTALIGLSIALGSAKGHAQDGNYPDKPVQVIVAWAAGGSVDTMGRALAAGMGQALGQQVVLLNRDGAAGIIGTSAVAGAAPDGYTLAFGPVTPITNAAQLLKKPPFGVDSFEYICQVFENRFGIAVPEGSPYKTLQQYLDAAKERPAEMSYGHLGNGSISHLSMEAAIQGKSLSLNGVSYRGEVPLFIDLIAGRLDAGVVSIGGALGSSRPVRFLAVIGDNRHPGIPDVPTLAELDLPTLLPALNGLFAPKGTPAAVRVKLQEACQTATHSEQMAAATRALQEQIRYLPGAGFERRVGKDYADKGALIKRLNLPLQ